MSIRLLLVVGLVAAGGSSLAWAQVEPATDRHGDALPEGAFARMGTVRLRGAAAPLVFSSDGKVLASVAQGSRLWEVVVWEVATGKPLRRLQVGATALSLSPDGKRLAAPYGAGSAVFDVATGRKLYSLQGEYGTFSDDGKLLFSADRYGD